MSKVWTLLALLNGGYSVERPRVVTKSLDVEARGCEQLAQGRSAPLVRRQLRQLAVAALARRRRSALAGPLASLGRGRPAFSPASLRPLRPSLASPRPLQPSLASLHPLLPSRRRRSALAGPLAALGRVGAAAAGVLDRRTAAELGDRPAQRVVGVEPRAARLRRLAGRRQVPRRRGDPAHGQLAADHVRRPAAPAAAARARRLDHAERPRQAEVAPAAPAARADERSRPAVYRPSPDRDPQRPVAQQGGGRVKGEDAKVELLSASWPDLV